MSAVHIIQARSTAHSPPFEWNVCACMNEDEAEQLRDTLEREVGSAIQAYTEFLATEDAGSSDLREKKIAMLNGSIPDPNVSVDAHVGSSITYDVRRVLFFQGFRGNT